jgi:carbonic anhydrase/acetyltransferase-like protein (isoleucine patch superfamily)
MSEAGCVIPGRGTKDHPGLSESVLRPSSGPMWRRLIQAAMLADCRSRGLTFGRSCRVLGRPRIRVVDEATVVCRDDVVLNSTPRGYHAGMSFPVTLFADRPGAEVVIGSGSRLHGCCIHAWSRISIGRKCLFAAGSQVLDAAGHLADLRFSRLRDRLQDVPEPVSIGDFSWLCLGAIVLKGTNLGEGSIVAAHAVVRAGVYPPYSLLAGSPAKVVRSVPMEDVLQEDYPIELLAAEGLGIHAY